MRRMLSFGDKYQLSLGEPITRELLHEAIAADVSLGSRCVHRHFMLLPDVASEDTPRPPYIGETGCSRT